MTLMFGSVPVPWTVSWSGEHRFFVAPCIYAGGRRAMCQSEAQGAGKPEFGKPHSNRQRQAIACDLCDICGRPLKNRTRVSLSHARPRQNAATPMDVLQVEPLLHRDCAALSLRHCPALKRDVRDGTAMIRQVFHSAVQFAILAPEHVGTYVPGYEAKPDDRIVGHAKVQLIRAELRDEAWLLRGGDRGRA